MTTVKLTCEHPLLIGDAHYEPGDLVLLTDERAAALVKGGFAEKADGTPKNKDQSLVADCIVPEPPGGAIVNPSNALAPNVADNPGLKTLVAVTKAAQVKAGTVKSDAVDVKAATEKPVAVGKDVTANEVVVAKESAPKAEPPKPAPPKAEVKPESPAAG